MATQVLNINVPVPEASKDVNGSYEWMSVRAGSASQFDRVKFNAPINQNAQMLYGNADLPNYVELAKVDNNSANVSVIAVGGTFQDLNNTVPYTLVQKNDLLGVYNPINLATGEITFASVQGVRGYYKILVSAGANSNVTGVQFRIVEGLTTMPNSISTAITVEPYSVNPNGTTVILTVPDPKSNILIVPEIVKLQVTSSTTNDILWIRSIDFLLASSPP